MASPLLLLGSTDLTVALAGRLATMKVAFAVMSPAAEFRISYSSDPVQNTRFVDMEGWCRDQGVPFVRYEDPGDIARVGQQAGAVAALLAGWYHLVPARVRQVFPRGCAGVHASLLPRYRGGAPLSWAMLNGEREAGVSLFELADGIDDGPLYAQRPFAIGADDYIADVLGRAETAAVELIGDVVPALLSGRAIARPQEGEPSYGLQRQPSDGRIDWRQPAAAIVRLVRSVSRPYPGAHTVFEGQPLIIWRARVADPAPPVHGAEGQIVRLSELPVPAIVTGDGLLLVEEVEGPDGFDLCALGRCHQRRLA